MRDKCMTKNTIRVVIVIGLLSLCCGNSQQSVQIKEERNANTIAFGHCSELSVDNIITFELNWVKNEYESHLSDKNFHFYRLPPPNCEQCSDLEQLLIYEKILDYKNWGTAYLDNRLSDRYLYTPLPTNIKGVLYDTKKNDEAIKRELRVIEVEFEEKFKEPTPWWWVCSAEERIKRLKEINMVGEIYSYSFAAKDRGDYKMGKAIATYEMWFKRPFPENTRCGNTDRLRKVEKALETGIPYLSEKEYTALKTKLKTEYQKKFRSQMPNSWLSVARVFYSWEPYTDGCSCYILITRIVSGNAVARLVIRCMSGYKYYSLELGMNDWLSTIYALNKQGVGEWEMKEIQSRYYSNSTGEVLKIFTLDSERYGFDEDGDCIGNIETREIIGEAHTLPPNWKIVGRVFEDMKIRIEKEGKENY